MLQGGIGLLNKKKISQYEVWFQNGRVELQEAGLPYLNVMEKGYIQTN